MSHARYPRGKVLREDEGKLQLAFTVVPDRKTLLIDFGKRVAWIGLGAKEVDGLIELLTKRRAEMIEATNADYD